METNSSIFSLGNDIYSGLVEFFENLSTNPYTNVKIVKFSAISNYPQIVFNQMRSKDISKTTRNEFAVKVNEYELNIYTQDYASNGSVIDALKVLEDLVDYCVYYLDNVLGAKSVNVTTGLQNFDSKNIMSEKAIIQFTFKSLNSKKIFI